MKNLIKIQQKLVPEIVEKMYRRFSILTTIAQYQPVGRRSLSEYMDLTERVLRSETDVLKKQALIKVKPTGMEITEAGETTVRQLNSYFNVYSDDHHLAQIIKEKYGIKDVYVIPGDSDTDKTVKIELSKQAGQLVEDVLYDHATVAVTGGSTMAYVSEAMHRQPYDVFLYLQEVGLVKTLYIKPIRLQPVWLSKQMEIIQRSMYQIMSVKQRIIHLC